MSFATAQELPGDWMGGCGRSGDHIGGTGAVAVVEADSFQRVLEYASWWDVPIAEVSDSDHVKAAYEDYHKHRDQERPFL